jgi:hypothetical protein
MKIFHKNDADPSTPAPRHWPQHHKISHGGPQYVLYSTGIESSLSSLYDLAGWNLLVKINWGKSGPKVA